MPRNVIDIAEEINVSIAKVHTITVDSNKLSQSINEFIFAYGLKQLLNDAGSAGKTADEKLEMAKGKLDRLYEGEVRRVGSAKAALDPVQAEAEKLAWAAIKKVLQAAGRKIADIDEDKRAKAIETHLAKNPEVLKTAKARIEALAKAKTETVDLADLGL